MKKLLPFIALFFFFSDLTNHLALSQKTLQEEVTVIAVEVPVRVIHKGQVVKNLTKEDFEIYENGVKQEITAFEIHSRKISIPKEISPEAMKIQPKKRLFILIFNIFDYNEAVEEGIDYFFENFFRQGDKLIILTEDRMLNIEIGKSLSGMILDLKETLKKYKLISTMNTFKSFRELRFEGDKLLAAFRGEFGDTDKAILRFYENYQRIWLNYRKQFITPNTVLYQSIIKRAKQIEGEKWAICFQQREIFPKLKNASRLDNEISGWIGSQLDPVKQVMARAVQVKQWELQRSFDISGNFPTELLKNLFMEANITFHLILMKSFRTLLSRDFELREVAQDYEACFKEISFSTGGHTAFSNKVSEALKEATETEDYYYLLVYSPKENKSAKKKDIEVKVKKRGAKVIHLKHFFEKETPPVSITDFKSGKKTIKFSLINYKMTKIKEKLTGIADIKITLFDENSEKVFAEGKTLNLFKKETHISLNFNWLKSGSYFIIIQVIDKISNEIDVFSSAIEL